MDGLQRQQTYGDDFYKKAIIIGNALEFLSASGTVGVPANNFRSVYGQKNNVSMYTNSGNLMLTPQVNQRNFWTYYQIPTTIVNNNSLMESGNQVKDTRLILSAKEAYERRLKALSRLKENISSSRQLRAKRISILLNIYR